MALNAVGTHKPEKRDRSAAELTVDRTRIALTHEQVSGRPAAQVKAALDAAASLSNVELPPVYVHVNRDGSLAMLTGRLPKGFVWPEDDPENARERLRG